MTLFLIKSFITYGIRCCSVFIYYLNVFIYCILYHFIYLYRFISSHGKTTQNSSNMDHIKSDLIRRHHTRSVSQGPWALKFTPTVVYFDVEIIIICPG